MSERNKSAIYAIQSTLGKFNGNRSVDTVNSEINRLISMSFDEYRCFVLFPNDTLLESLISGVVQDPESVFSGIRDELFTSVAESRRFLRDRLKENVYLSHLLLEFVKILYQALAELGPGRAWGRRYVIIKEPPGYGLSYKEGENGWSFVARSGHGTAWSELPSIYFTVETLAVISAADGIAGFTASQALARIISAQEDTIDNGYAFTEEPDADLRHIVDEISERLAADQELYSTWTEPLDVTRRGPREFGAKLRNEMLEKLDARVAGDEFSFNTDVCVQAVRDIGRFAAGYKRAGNDESLRECVRLLVSASGHDEHPVRDLANITLERIFAAKDFAAPLSTNFFTLSSGEKHHFSFNIGKKGTYFLRVFGYKPDGSLPTDTNVEYMDFKLTGTKDGNYETECSFEEIGIFDYLVISRTQKTVRAVDSDGCAGRISIIPDVRGELVLQIFPEVHGHARTFWQLDPEFPGLVYDERGKVIRLSGFKDISRHLAYLKSTYSITAVYLLGVQKRGSNREDWAPEATSPSPFSPMSLVDIEPTLGGETGLKDLISTAHDLGIKIIVDVIPHINRTSEAVDDSFKVYCHDDNGGLVPRAATDGRFGSWNDGMLLNYRRFEVWEWLADSIGKLIETYDIDGIRFDSAHALPIMMKRFTGRVTQEDVLSVENVVEGKVVLNDREDDHFITTGYYDSSCREYIANPFLTYLAMRLGKMVKARGKKTFLFLAESYWGRERYLTRTACMPYNSSLFKICEKVIQGISDVREIYHLYGEYYRSALPAGTKLLGILGNHDERRPLNTFGERGLRAAIGLIVFLNPIVMDFEGNAEGEGWKIFVDNIFVNWNEFEAMSNRGVRSFYKDIYKFHVEHTGDAYLVWANNNQVAAVALFTEESIWLGAFNFSGSGQEAYIQFDDPNLPFDDDAPYVLTDPMYGKVTNRTVHFVGKELRISRIRLFVSDTDRIRLLRLDPAPLSCRNDDDYILDSFQRLITLEDADGIESNLFFENFRNWATSSGTLMEKLSKLLPQLESRLPPADIQTGFARSIFHLARVGGNSAADLERLIKLMGNSDEESIKDLGNALEKWNRKGPLVFLAAEADPFSKSGGLASVVADLPRELAAKGEETVVITPKYRYGSEKAVSKMEEAVKAHGVTYSGRNVSFYLDGVQYEVGVHTAVIEGTRYYLLDHSEFFDGLYWGCTAEEKIRRRVAFVRASCELIVTFDINPLFVVTNDAFAGLFGPIMRRDPHYIVHPAFEKTKLIHLIHNGGWEYFDAFYRYETGRDLCSILGLPGDNEWLVTEPGRDDKINCMAAGIRNADRVFTVSPSYARQIQERCDGLENILHDVVGINNALNRGFRAQARKKAYDRFVGDQYEVLAERIKDDETLAGKVKSRFPQIAGGPAAVRKIANERRRLLVERMMIKLMLQVHEGLEVDPDKVLCVMIHRICEQKGFQLLLEASEGVFKFLGFQAIVGGIPASGDTRGEELARGIGALGGYYPGNVSAHIDFVDVRIPLLGADVFLMPSMNEPGGISQLEALACGCIVVARSTGGLRDTVAPIRRRGRTIEGNGFLFPDYTSWSFYHAMERCMLFFSSSNDEEIATARRNAVRSVRYWDETADAYIRELYNMREMLHPMLG